MLAIYVHALLNLALLCFASADEVRRVPASSRRARLPRPGLVVLDPGLPAAGAREAGQRAQAPLREAPALPQRSPLAVQRAGGAVQGGELGWVVGEEKEKEKEKGRRDTSRFFLFVLAFYLNLWLFFVLSGVLYFTEVLCHKLTTAVGGFCAACVLALRPRLVLSVQGR